MVDPDLQALVFDVGSLDTHAGFSGDDSPRATFPSSIPVLKDPFTVSKKDTLETSDSVPRKRIYSREKETINFNEMEKLLHHILYNEFKIEPKKHPLFLTEPPKNSKVNREKTTVMAFETFCTPAFFLCSSATCSLYASGRTLGLVLKSGDLYSYAVPFYEGHQIQHAVMKIDLGGKDVSEYLLKLLEQTGKDSLLLPHREKMDFLLREIKEKCCYISLDYDSDIRKFEEVLDLDSSPNKEYTLPDGKKLNLGSEIFKCSEILFNPKIYNNDHEIKCGVDRLIENAVRHCDADFHLYDVYTYGNIVLAGGSTMFEGFGERLHQEITKFVSPYKRVKVNAIAERKLSGWIGGSIFSSLSTFQNYWISKDEYDNAGATIVHRKCF